MKFGETPLKGAYLIDLEKKVTTEVSSHVFFVKMNLRSITL